MVEERTTGTNIAVRGIATRNQSPSKLPNLRSQRFGPINHPPGDAAC
jgi:hypothetical protein